jgi:dCMP deaminase
MRIDNLSWDMSFFGIAFMAAMRSKDPSTQCGACIVRGNRPLGWGYNGFVLGTDDDASKWESTAKLDWVVHAERNAIINSFQAGVSDLSNSEMYIWTSNPHRVHLPCKDCARTIAQCSIPTVHVSVDPEVLKSGNLIDERWGTDVSLKILENAGISLVYHSSAEVNAKLFGVALKKLKI